MNILQQFKPVTGFIIDFEHGMGGGKLTLSPGAETPAITMDLRDVYAVEAAITAGYPVIFFSRYAFAQVPFSVKTNPIIISGSESRSALLQQLATEGKAALSTTLFLGGELPDVEAMKLSGFACAAADAPYEVKLAAQYISPLNGGNGAVRDVIEKVLKINNKWGL